MIAVLMKQPFGDHGIGLGFLRDPVARLLASRQVTRFLVSEMM
jgi:hypothetical protein